MNLDTSKIVLIASYRLKDKEDNITTFKQLQDFLTLEKSQISQCLKTNEKKGLIRKPEGRERFNTILITPNGISKAQRYIRFLNNLLNDSKTQPQPEIQKQKTPPKKDQSKTLPVRKDFGKLIDNFSNEIHTPLKSSIKESLSDYIPKSHIDDGLLKDLTSTTIDLIYEHLSTFFKDIFT